MIDHKQWHEKGPARAHLKIRSRYAFEGVHHRYSVALQKISPRRRCARSRSNVTGSPLQLLFDAGVISIHRPTKRRLKETVCWLLFAAGEMKCLPRLDEFANVLRPQFREEGRLHYRVTDIGQITIQGSFPKSPSRPPSAGHHPVPDVRCGQRDAIELSECRKHRGASPEQLYF